MNTDCRDRHRYSGDPGDGLALTEANQFQRLVRRDAVIIGSPTLLELRMVLTDKGFANAAAIVDQLAELPNVTAVAFDQAHYRAAERAFDRFGNGRRQQQREIEPDHGMPSAVEQVLRQ